MPKRNKVVIFDDFWTVEDVKRYPYALFVYGDNDVKQGKGGQAIIRDLPNTIGIPTKKYPNNRPISFYTEGEYDQNIKKIDQAIANIIKEATKYRYVVFPENGFGTGLARLPDKAPKTLDYLMKQVQLLKEKIEKSNVK